MILPAARLQRDSVFLLLRFKYEVPRLPVYEAARDEAVALAGEPRDEAAALFFAFARRRDDLGTAWPLLPALLAKNHAAVRLRLPLDATLDELRLLSLQVNALGLAFEHVRDWFRERM